MGTYGNPKSIAPCLVDFDPGRGSPFSGWIQTTFGGAPTPLLKEGFYLDSGSTVLGRSTNLGDNCENQR